MNVTLKTIAERAGVSIRTVTRALKGEPGGHPRTGDRVRACADALGYTPNLAARHLRTRQRPTVGIVGPDSALPVYTRKILSLQRTLAQRGRYTLSGLLPDTPDALSRMLREWAGWVRHVVFFAWRADWEIASVAAPLGLTCYFVDCPAAPAAMPRLEINRRAGIQAGVEALMDAGRKKIARAGTMLENRAAGFRDAFRARGRRPARRALYPTDGLEFADGYRIGPALLRDGVDGVFFDTDRLALGFLKFARERGVRVPGDVAVIGFDDDPAGQYVCPALSTVAHPIEDMSRTLAQWIETETGGRKRRVFPTRFVRRESV